MTTEKDPPAGMVLMYCVAWTALLIACLALFLVFMSARRTNQRVDQLWLEQHKWIELTNDLMQRKVESFTNDVYAPPDTPTVR